MSARFGFDRGTPIDRAYTVDFLHRHAPDVRGVVGEVADDGYARLLAGPAVERVEVIDNERSNRRATMSVDLEQSGALPTGAFDCLIVTQVLQYTRDPAAVLANCVGGLRPGGVLLLAVPALAAHDTHEADARDYWRFWPAGLRHLLSQAAPGATTEIEGRGNLTVALAYLHGLAAEELEPGELAHVDPRYPIVVHARVAP